MPKLYHSSVLNGKVPDNPRTYPGNPSQSPIPRNDHAGGFGCAVGGKWSDSATPYAAILVSSRFWLNVEIFDLLYRDAVEHILSLKNNNGAPRAQ
jgi:hypothetical protein